MLSRAMLTRHQRWKRVETRTHITAHLLINRLTQVSHNRSIAEDKPLEIEHLGGDALAVRLAEDEITCTGPACAQAMFRLSGICVYALTVIYNMFRSICLGADPVFQKVVDSVTRTAKK